MLCPGMIELWVHSRILTQLQSETSQTESAARQQAYPRIIYSIQQPKFSTSVKELQLSSSKTRKWQQDG